MKNYRLQIPNSLLNLTDFFHDTAELLKKNNTGGLSDFSLNTDTATNSIILETSNESLKKFILHTYPKSRDLNKWYEIMYFKGTDKQVLKEKALNEIFTICSTFRHHKSILPDVWISSERIILNAPHVSIFNINFKIEEIETPSLNGFILQNLDKLI